MKKMQVATNVNDSDLNFKHHLVFLSLDLTALPRERVHQLLAQALDSQLRRLDLEAIYEDDASYNEFVDDDGPLHLPVHGISSDLRNQFDLNQILGASALNASSRLLSECRFYLSNKDDRVWFIFPEQAVKFLRGPVDHEPHVTPDDEHDPLAAVEVAARKSSEEFRSVMFDRGLWFAIGATVGGLVTYFAH